MADEEYTLEQAEDDITWLRQQMQLLNEILIQNDFTAGNAPNQPTTGYSQYSSAGEAKYASSDGNDYNMGALILNATSAPTINSATLSTIPGLTCSLANGVNYRVSGMIIIQPNIAGGQPQFQFTASGGLTAGNFREIMYEWFIGAGGGAGGLGDIAELFPALGTLFSGQAVGAGLQERAYTFDGVAQINGTGTLSLQAAVSIAADTYTIRQWGTFMMVQPIT